MGVEAKYLHILKCKCYVYIGFFFLKVYEIKCMLMLNV